MKITKELSYTIERGGDQIILTEDEIIELRDDLITLLVGTNK